MLVIANLLSQFTSQKQVMRFILIIALMICPVALAQSGAGSIEGTVTDRAGALIPGASIHVVNQETNVAINTKANSVGFYQVPGLFTGKYSMTVSARGMAAYQRQIELLVGQNDVINPALVPGEVSQKGRGSR